MKNKKIPANLPELFQLPVLILVFLTISAAGQDFILTKSNELIECDIIIDSPAYIQYRKDPKIFKYQKSSIAGYTILSERKHYASLEITDHQGVLLLGRFLFADQDSLYFWRGSKVYHPNEGSFLAISTNQANRIVIYREGDYNKGLGTYVIVQLDDPKNEMATRLQFIQRNAMLKTPPIKAMGRDTIQSNWVSHNKSLYKSPRARQVKTNLPQPSTFAHNVDQGNRVNSLDSVKVSRKAKGQTKVSIQIFGGVQLISAQRNDIYASLKQSGQGGSLQGYSWYSGAYTAMFPIKLNSAAFRDFSVELALKKSHRLSLLYTNTISFGGEGITGITEVGEKSAIEFYYLYVPKPYIPYKTSKWVSSFGIGPSVNFLEMEVAGGGKSNIYREKYKPGLSSQLTCSYYALPNFSLGMRVLGRIVPSMTIPESSELKEHKINCSSLDFAFGIGVHF